MGYRAHTVTQHREYGSSVFSDFTQFEDYFYKLHELYPDAELFQSENQDFFEIGKDVVEKEVNRLKELGGTDFEFQSAWVGEYKDKNSEIARSWEEALKETPEDSEYVSFEWY